MKETVSFQFVTSHDLGPEGWLEAQRRFPECCFPGTPVCSFQGGYDADDPRLREVMGFLASHGWQPSKGWFGKLGPKEYWLRIKRKYSKSDFDTFQYFIFGGGGSPWEGGGGVDETPLTVLSTKGMKPDDIRMVGLQRRVVPQRVRAIFEAEGVRHVTFHATLVAPGWPTDFSKILTWEEMHEEPWWELRSDVVLPPLSPRCRLSDLDGNDYNPDGPFRGLYVEEGNHENPEMHYRASDLAKLPEFDVALTRENLGAGNRDEIGTLVCSQRFRKMCQKHKLKVGFWPVRVDPE